MCHIQFLKFHEYGDLANKERASIALFCTFPCVLCTATIWRGPLNFSLIGIKWNLCARLWLSPQFSCNIINLQTFKKDGQVNCWNKRTQRKRPITRNESMLREFKMQTFIYLLKVAKTITLAFKCVGKCFLARGFKGTAFSYSFTFSLI